MLNRISPWLKVTGLQNCENYWIRSVQLKQKMSNQLYDNENSRDFWNRIGKIGISNVRNHQISFKVLDGDNSKRDKKKKKVQCQNGKRF